MPIAAARTSLNHDPRMRNPPHVCTSVRSLQPMYVHPSLQHMCVHRFASRIHLRNHVTQVWLAGNECKHLSRNSTCILSQHIACASIRSLQPTLPVHRCSTSMRPSLRCANALASMGLSSSAIKLLSKFLQSRKELQNVNKSICRTFALSSLPT